MPPAPTAKFGSVNAFLAPAFREKGIDEKFLLWPIATLFMKLELPSVGTVFSVDSGESYALELFLTPEGEICLWRNGLAASVWCSGAGWLILDILWTPTCLQLGATGASGQRIGGQRLHTPPAGLPSFLPAWLRDKAILPRTTYESAEEVLDEIVTQLEYLGEKIRKTAAVDGFWDDQYKGKKVVGQVPKKETKLTRTIALFLTDLEYTKNIQVYPEALAGPGRMDFLFVATLHGGETVKVCAEFKHIHAAKLLSGIETQLPIYMNNKDTAYGVFCAFDFGGKYRMRAKPRLEHPSASRDPRNVLAEYAVRHAPLMQIRSVVLPMSPLPSPSSL